MDPKKPCPLSQSNGDLQKKLTWGRLIRTVFQKELPKEVLVVHPTFSAPRGCFNQIQAKLLNIRIPARCLNKPSYLLFKRRVLQCTFFDVTPKSFFAWFKFWTWKLQDFQNWITDGLVGGWFQPIWKIWASPIGSFPQGSGWKLKIIETTA